MINSQFNKHPQLSGEISLEGSLKTETRRNSQQTSCLLFCILNIDRFYGKVLNIVDILYIPMMFTAQLKVHINKIIKKFATHYKV